LSNIPIILSFAARFKLLKDSFGDCKGRVDGCQPIFLWFEKRKSSYSEECVKYVHCVSRSIADPSFFWVLAVQDKQFEGLFIDPVLFSHHAESGVNPPRVADIWQFLGPTIEASL